MKKTNWIIFLFLVWSIATQAQQGSSEEFFRRIIGFLASDSLEGRETSSQGELLAGNYIEMLYRRAHLIPVGDRGSFADKFKYFAGKEYSTKNNLSINGDPLRIKEDYYALNFSGNGSAEGKCVFVNFGIEDTNYSDYTNLKGISGKIFVMKAGGPAPYNDPHSEKGALADLKFKCELAQKKGAIAVIVVNTDSSISDPKANLNMKAAEINIPVVFVREEIARAWNFLKPGEASLQVDMYKQEKEGTNICGFLDFKRPNTIVIGAHYDHLGWGIPGSLFTGTRAIHNGADDNASGTAMMLEMLRQISGRKELQYYNYMFIAFSGEELGLYGSKSFCDSLLGDVKRYNCMINFDMVGRLDSLEPTVEINGVGTSPQWSKYLDSVRVDNLKIKRGESGVGPSDHTSFYLKGLPVLHYFTGTHSDYHKPSDDANKINYKGMLKVLEHVMSLLQEVNYGPQMEYTKTKEESNTNAPRFTVTLGVIPDYMFEGKGMRIDGTTDGKPAAVAGLQAKDVVIKLGDYEITDMMGYMKALSYFKKGDKTTVTFIRGEETLVKDLQF